MTPESAPVFSVLFLCAANGARSAMAEAILRKLGGARFQAWSAASQAAEPVPGPVLAALADHGFSTSDLAPGGLAAFSGPQAPRIDIVISLSDDDAGEARPVWPDRPPTAHWSIAAPPEASAAVAGDATTADAILATLVKRIGLFTNLPSEGLDRLATTGRARSAPSLPIA